MLTKKSILFLSLLFLMPPWGTASGSDELSDKALLLKKADEAIERLDRKTADFYIARYLGVCAGEAPEACPEEALQPFLKKRRLNPKGFLPDTWDPAFLDWFEKSVHDRWGVPPERIREKSRSFEIAQSTHKDKYFVTVAAYPELEQWYVMKEGLASKPMLLAMASFRDHPTLFFGRTLKGASVQEYPTYLDTQKKTLHYFWKPEFFDVDGDGTPEAWLRFNLAWGNGYSQVLEVYKFRQNGKSELFHHFQGGLNGYVRRLEDGTVELGGIVRPSSATYHVETWRFENKEFKKAAEKDIPVSKSPNWPPVEART